jgi:hypothetical protein
MTDREVAQAIALGRCNFLPAAAEKRFARAMAERAAVSPAAPLSPLQAKYLGDLSWRFRRQMPADLVPAVKPS